MPFISKILAIPPETQLNLPYRVFNLYVRELSKENGYFAKL